MNPGMPGAGVGALFYIILALLMPVRELSLTVHGRSNRKRWLAVGRQWTIAAGIVLAQVLGFVCLSRLGLLLFSASASPLLARLDNALLLVSVAGAMVVTSSVVAGRWFARRS